VVALMVNFLTNLWAIPRFGIVGAAWATALTEAVACGMMVFGLFKKTLTR